MDKVDLVKRSGVWDTIGYTTEIQKLIDMVAQEERQRSIVQVEREKQTWHFTSSSRAVRTACDNIISMIRGDK